MRFAALLLLIATTTYAQWEIQDAHTSASLRGIHSVGGGVAWASGTSGTTLRTVDDGKTWQTCAIPLAGTKDGAEKLDFRGIQAFDEKTAIVMSSGTGDLSRLYKTTDGCQTWKLLFTNPDKDGFWDALRALSQDEVEIAGDAVDHHDGGATIRHATPIWRWSGNHETKHGATDLLLELHADPGEGGFAASNSTFVMSGRPDRNPDEPNRDPLWRYEWLATQTPDHSYVTRQTIEATATCESCQAGRLRIGTPMNQGSPSAGIFSLAFRDDRFGVAVGGDYQAPTLTIKTAIYSDDAGGSWGLAQTPPHGYRSAVAYDAPSRTWITVGPNGTDISTDDGHNWHPLPPGPQDASDADKNWNALSLPFVVGPKGRIGKLRSTALESHLEKPAKK